MENFEDKDNDINDINDINDKDCGTLSQMNMQSHIISILPTWINGRRASRPLLNIQIYN